MKPSFILSRATVVAAALAFSSLASAGTKPMLVSVAVSPALGADEFTTATQACVAAARTASANALSACDSAVSIAQTELHIARSSTMSIYAVPMARRSLALALSNRAVARWMIGQATDADIARASKLAPTEEFVRTNVAALATPRVPTLAAR
jgi:hypothetical protein